MNFFSVSLESPAYGSVWQPVSVWERMGRKSVRMPLPCANVKWLNTESLGNEANEYTAAGVHNAKQACFNLFEHTALGLQRGIGGLGT